jgi:hypothetical protein
LAGYALGDNVHRLSGPVGIVSVVLAVMAIIAVFIIVRRNEQRLEEEAERALPGPLDKHVQTSGASKQRSRAGS